MMLQSRHNNGQRQRQRHSVSFVPSSSSPSVASTFGSSGSRRARRRRQAVRSNDSLSTGSSSSSSRSDALSPSPEPSFHLQQQQQQQHHHHQQYQARRIRRLRTEADRQRFRKHLFRVYFYLSVLLAIMAVVSKPVFPFDGSAPAPPSAKLYSSISSQQSSSSSSPSPPSSTRTKRKNLLARIFQRKDGEPLPKWVQRFIPRRFKKIPPPPPPPPPPPKHLAWVDECILRRTSVSKTIVQLWNKVTDSTLRVLCLCNCYLAFILVLYKWLSHAFFAGNSLQQRPVSNTAMTTMTTMAMTTSSNATTASRRGNGLWSFQFLLLTVVLPPTSSFPLWLWLVWCIGLFFMQSLSNLAADYTTHTSQSGQPPHSGALQLILLVLLVNSGALAALVLSNSSSNNWTLVLLFGYDCVVLAMDSVSQVVLKHWQQVLEQRHTRRVAAVEEAKQILLDQQAAAGDDDDDDDPYESSLRWDDSDASLFANDLSGIEHVSSDSEGGLRQYTIPMCMPVTPQRTLVFSQECRMLDTRLETMERLHRLRTSFLDCIIFRMELGGFILQAAHFAHVWYLYGLQFNLIDLVLVLHLHSTMRAATQKVLSCSWAFDFACGMDSHPLFGLLLQVAERRNLKKIARDLDAMFPDATEEDLRKEGGSMMCCICLNTMTTLGSTKTTTTGLKKVACGHIFHTHCLRDVMERSGSIETAKCPLCRSLLTGNGSSALDTSAANQTPPPLYRFTTVGLPSWIPIPPMSVEVLRRQTNNSPQSQENRNVNTRNVNTEGRRQRERPQSSWRQLWTVLRGTGSLTADEERQAMAQLVDMFPQYDRNDILQELRRRRSADGVVESILLGLFSGQPRGGATIEVSTNQDVIDTIIESSEYQPRARPRADTPPVEDDAHIDAAMFTIAQDGNDLRFLYHEEDDDDGDLTFEPPTPRRLFA